MNNKKFCIIFCTILSLFSNSMLFANPNKTHDMQTVARAKKIEIVKNMNQPIVLNRKVNDFAIKLAANSNKGYSWYLSDYNRNLLHLIGFKRHTDYNEFRFKLLHTAKIAPIVTEIEFIYAKGNYHEIDDKDITLVIK